MSQMQITGAAVVNVQKISGFLDKLFNKTAKVNIGLVGDSTIAYAGNGWDAGVPEALLRMGFQQHGTGLVGAGEKISLGHGHKQAEYAGNAVPGVTSNNGFTAALPVEWSPYLTNWGDDTKRDPLIDSQLTFVGALKPFCVTAGVSNTSNGNLAYYIQGNDQLGSSYDRPFSGLKQALNIQHWYLRTSGSTGGNVRNIQIRRSTDGNHAQSVEIFNFNGVSASAAGTTFSFTIGLTQTPGITFTHVTATLQSRILASLTGAGFSASSVSVPTQAGYLYAGDLGINIVYNISTAGFEYPGITANIAGFTGRYYDASIGYANGVTTQSASKKAGFFYQNMFGSTVFGLTSYNGTLRTTGLTHLELTTFPNIAATADRDYGIQLQWAGRSDGGISGPWCSLFTATSISGATQGFSTTTLVQMSGCGSRRHAGALLNQSYTTLGTWFQALAEHAGYTSAANAPLLIRVITGVNDRNDGGLTSIGPSGGLACNTRDGVRDNWQAMINHVNNAYAANGWAASNLYWLFTPSPMVAGETGNSQLLFAQQAAVDISNANPRTAAVNLFTISGITAPNRLSNFDNSGVQDTVHHTNTGYRAYSQYEWSNLQSAYNATLSSTPPTARISWTPNPAYDNNADNLVTVIANGLGSTAAAGRTITNYNFAWIEMNAPTSDDYPGGTAQLMLDSPYVGNYRGDVTLTVTDDTGATGATTVNIPTFANVAPVASFNATPSFSTILGQGITFTSTSTDSFGGNIVSQSWLVTPGSQTASTSTARFVFGATGTYTVRLTVTDDGGATGATTGTVTVSSGSSQAIITSNPQSPVRDHNNDGSELFVLSATASTFAGATPSSYLWSTGGTGATTSINVSVGSSSVSLTMSDSLGFVSYATQTLTVQPNLAPTATITVSPNTTVTDTDGNGFETFILSGLSSIDNGGTGGSIVSYQWNTGATGATTSIVVPVGATSVWLIVTDNGNATGYDSKTLTVNSQMRGAGSVGAGSTVWFAGKLYTQEQYTQILQAFYPNLIR